MSDNKIVKPIDTFSPLDTGTKNTNNATIVNNIQGIIML
jgi:hypothetical protein